MRFFLSLCIGACSAFAAGTCWGDQTDVSLPFLIILYGPQGSGRAAIAARLHIEYNIPAISPATYLTSNVIDETPLGKKARDYVIHGGPMPPDLIPSLVCDRLLQSDCLQGALMEDTPLTLPQIKAIQECLALRFQILAINIKTSEQWILQRAECRLVCRTCGKVFDLPNPSPEPQCDICFSPLTRRQADMPEAVRSKIHEYQASVTPLLNWYGEENRLIEIQGEKGFEELYGEISTIVQLRTGLPPSKSQQPFQPE